MESGYLTMIFKRGNRTKCKNYKEITITGSTGHVYRKIVMACTENGIDETANSRFQ
jgi:hypothetical protein